MSLTNAAFIKAYGASPLAIEAAPAVEARSTATASESQPDEISPSPDAAPQADQSGASQSVASEVESHGLPVVSSAVNSAVAVPAPHFDMTADVDPDDPSRRTTLRRPAGPEKATQEEVVALPLSSYLGLSAQTPFTAAAPATSLRATRQIDRFVWPDVCQTISEVAGDEIDAIARSILQSSARGQKLIAVTGCRRGEGRTTLLQCVARALRETGASITLVDADVHQPALAERFGLQPEIGWEDVLLGTCQLPEALVHSAADRITLLPRRRPLSGEAEDAQRTKQEVMFRMIRDQCDVVLFDTGPLLEDAACGVTWLADCGLIDAAIVVFDPRRGCERRLSRVLKTLESRGVPQAGVVENFAAVAATTGRHLRRDMVGQ